MDALKSPNILRISSVWIDVDLVFGSKRGLKFVIGGPPSTASGAAIPTSLATGPSISPISERLGNEPSEIPFLIRIISLPGPARLLPTPAVIRSPH